MSFLCFRFRGGSSHVWLHVLVCIMISWTNRTLFKIISYWRRIFSSWKGDREYSFVHNFILWQITVMNKSRIGVQNILIRVRYLVEFLAVCSSSHSSINDALISQRKFACWPGEKTQAALQSGLENLIRASFWNNISRWYGWIWIYSAWWIRY